MDGEHIVLLIDDNQMFCKSLQHSIDWHKMRCRLSAVAENGLKGMEEYKLHKPDIIISDIHMPGMDGLELVRKIRQTDTSCKIIFITGYQEFNYAQEAVRLGAFDFLLKPIKRKNLCETIEKAVAQLEKEQLDQRAPTNQAHSSLGQDALSEHRFLALQICLLIERSLHSKWMDMFDNIVENLNKISSADEMNDYVEKYFQKLRQSKVEEIENPLVNSVFNYIAQVYDMDITLAATADKFFLNASYLCRLLKKETNLSFKEILTNKRMEAAVQMLNTTNMKVADIANKVGYNDYGYFCKVFKGRTGYSPSDFRKQKLV